MGGITLTPLERAAYAMTRWTDIDNATLRRAVKAFAGSIPPGARVLDAGAGLQPYAELFAHCRYESCDFAGVDTFYGNINEQRRSHLAGRQTYVCPLDAIPVPDRTYDFILCTQVLEHVPDPPLVLKELNRILTETGRLFLTVPQGYGVHGEPYNYFYFTKYGVELIMKRADFDVLSIEERGGYFYYLYDRLALAMPRIVMGYRTHRVFMMMVLAPLHILLAYLFGPLLLLLEPLDREKRFTLGYIAVAGKRPGGEESARRVC
jgi:SAM-dependent methyltransferase